MRTGKIIFAIIFFISFTLISFYALSYKQNSSPGTKNTAPSEQPGETETERPVPEEKPLSAPEPAVTENKPGRVPDAEAGKKSKDPNKTYIAFTFDDGYLSDYELAYPILKKYNIRGTSYIIPEYQDQSRQNAMTWQEVKEMAEYGWVFGCHTYAHTDLKKMTPDEIRESMRMVDEAFTKQGLTPPVVHAFPYGSYDREAIEAMKPFRVQMRKAFYESKLIDINNIDPYEIDSVSADMRTRKLLNQHKEMVDIACREKAVIVFRCHCLYKNNPDDMGEWPVQTDSDLFRQLVEYCVAKGCEFITMTELMEMYG
jgi:peptidoglycan/xylan/chitin deacetylase (PgdA/CDA1 family)